MLEEVPSRPTSVAVLSRSFSSHPVLRSELAARFDDVTFNDTSRTLGGDELIDFLMPHDAAIVALERVDRDLLSRLSNLRILSKYGVGLDNVDLAAAADLGIAVGWEGGVNRRSVAELAICFMIAGLRGVMVSHSEVISGIWRQYRGRQLSHVTVGLIGFGHVGKELARLLRAFGSRVLAYDIRDLSTDAEALGVELVGLDRLLRESDVVSLHVPLTTATSMMIDRTALELFKPGAVLVNTARGGLVDEAALREALERGKLAGAGFDVFSIEPPHNPDLFNAPGFIGTAHIGGSAEEAVLAMGRAAIEGLFQAKDPLSFVPDWAA